MNKKFSTLVASLLLTSAFSVYSVDAKPMLATPTQVETRAAAADVEEAVEVGTAALPTYPTTLDGKVLPGFTNYAQIVTVATLGSSETTEQYVGVNASGDVVRTQNGYNNLNDAPNYYWQLINGRLVTNSNIEFSLSGLDEYIEIVPIVKDGKATEFFAIAKRDNDGNLQYVEFTSPNVLGWSANKAQDPETNIGSALLFMSVETEYNTPISAADMNKVLDDGFMLSIASKIDEDAAIVDENVFEGAKITADETQSPYYQLKKDGKFIVFDTNVVNTSDGYSKDGKFKLVDTPATGQWSYFQISKADNGTDDIIVRVYSKKSGPASGKYPYRLYIANAAGTYTVSISAENGKCDAIDWAATALDENNIVNPKEFLTGQFYTIDYKGNVDPEDVEAYKEDGRLALRYANSGALQADFVKAASLYTKAPEAQWAVAAHFNSAKNIDGFTLINRENPTIKITIDELRRVEEKAYYRVASTIGTSGIDKGDFITMTPVTTISPRDGYEFDVTNLTNETYYLGQIRQAEAEEDDLNVYWSENHAASHQIGATVEEASATKWNLSLVNKGNKAEVDSVLVDSWLYKWNDEKSRIDSTKETLVILPFAFKNRSNNEYVQLNQETNLNYYICDKDDEKGYQYGVDAIFALKRKADINGNPVYNYIALPNRLNNDGKTYDYNKDNSVKHISTLSESSFSGEKVYQENSTYYGTWKNMRLYADDANSLMFVNKVEAPEYRKLVTTANLDTIRLFRADNEAQVVYEKKDPKSVVEGDTLSFLNIDNETQFTTINPALYADTAYVNRGNNTCWQYLLGVNIEHKEGYYCAEHGFNVTPPCEHAVPVSYNEGRYLVNLIDTANAYAANKGIHNNPYINESEEGRQLAKLGFVHGIHVLTDSVDMTKADHLYLIKGDAEGDTIPVALNTPAFNNVKFAFKYVDYMENTEEFKIQTSYKPYVDDTNAPAASEEGYLRWVNGCIVVDNGYTRGDVFNMDENETRTPTANETIESAADATISVVAVDGAVIVKGAEGKNVIVSTILGKVVANEVLNSDNETIAAPAGIVVVSVDGESFKVAVK